MPSRLKTSTLLLKTSMLLLVAVGLLLGVPGPMARAQQPAADPPPTRPGAQPGADAPRSQPGQPGTRPVQPGASPKQSPGPWERLKAPVVSEDRTSARKPAPAERRPTPGATPGGAARAGKNGFVLQLNLGTDFASSALSGSAMIYGYLYGGGPGINGSFSFGYRSNRWVLSLGMDFRRFVTSSDGDKMAVSVVTFRPSVSYDLVSTYPMALYVTLGLPVGFRASEGDAGGYYTDSSDGKDPVVGFVVGLGARYFFHPQFAIGMEGAFKGLWVSATSEDYYDNSERIFIGNVAFSGSVFMMAIF